jgi:hypothetical protein
MKKIKLSQGKVALVDDEDFELVSKYKWNLTINGKAKYGQTKINGKNVRIHRLVMNAKAGQIVDHVNGNGLDNRKSNLRFCTKSQNSANRTSIQDNQSGILGVHWDKKRLKWVMQIRGIEKKMQKYFHCPFAAAKEYDSLAKKYFGKFAKTNEDFGLYQFKAFKEKQKGER